MYMAVHGPQLSVTMVSGSPPATRPKSASSRQTAPAGLAGNAARSVALRRLLKAGFFHARIVFLCDIVITSFLGGAVGANCGANANAVECVSLYWLGDLVLELTGDKRCVCATLSKQSLMGALLHDVATLEHQNGIGIAHCAQSVGDDDSRAGDRGKMLVHC
jgi:hypothetical protein